MSNKTEENILAEFMELSYKNDVWYFPESWRLRGVGQWTTHLHFHDSWDWLMPVVEKIKKDESLRIFLPAGGLTESIAPFVNAISPINRALLSLDRGAVFDAVVKFINWHNQNKPS